MGVPFLPPGIQEDAIAGIIAKSFKVDKKVMAKLSSLSKDTLAAMKSEMRMGERIALAERQLDELVKGKIPSGCKPHVLPFISKLWARPIPTAAGPGVREQRPI